MSVLRLPIGEPQLDESAYIASGAQLIGDVQVAAEASIWFNAVLRADTAPITVGQRSNLQDLVACHSDPDAPLCIGAGVTVGHGAVLHGCEVADDVLVGMNATVLNGATIGGGTIVAAGAVVTGGTAIPPGCLVAGVPARVRRPLGSGELASIRQSAADYVALAAKYRKHARRGG